MVSKIEIFKVNFEVVFGVCVVSFIEVIGELMFVVKVSDYFEVVKMLCDDLKFCFE